MMENTVLNTFQIRPVSGIYIHIPFCRSKCRYCTFVSGAYPEGLREQYITALQGEIVSQRDNPQFGTCDEQDFRRLSSLYIGGGTPSEMTLPQTESLMNTVERTFSFKDDAERTIEVNPTSESYEKLRAYRGMGFNRVSFGVQSLNDETLRRLGRTHTAAEAMESVSEAIRAGFENISVDCMFGLPGQTLDQIDHFVDTFAKVPEVRHLSAYALQIEEGSVFYKEYERGNLILPEEETERAMCHHLERKAWETGFKQYEISNFASPGYEARHNGSYWDLSGYWGFGVSASFYGHGVRGPNPMTIRDYLRNPVPEERHACDREEAMGDFMFLGLRRNKGVSDMDFYHQFGQHIDTVWPDALTSLIKRGLLTKTEEGYALTPLGRDLANQVFVEFV